MAYDERLAGRVREQLRRKSGFAEKKMFGGVAFLLHGQMCAGIWRDSLIVRLDATRCDERRREPHVRPFDITGKVMRGWLLVEGDGLRSEEALCDWLAAAQDFLKTLPTKERGKKSAPKPRKKSATKGTPRFLPHPGF